MSSLSAAATTILNYAKNHVEGDDNDGFVDLQDYTGFPEKIVTNACEELLRRGFISDIGYSGDSVEYILLTSK